MYAPPALAPAPAVPKTEPAPDPRIVQHIVGPRNVIMAITGGSARTLDSKRQKREHVRQVMHVAASPLVARS